MLKITDDNVLLNLLRKRKDFEDLGQKFNEKNIYLINLFKDRANNLCDIIKNINKFSLEHREFNEEEKELIEPLIKNKDLILKNLNNIEIWNHENIEKELKKTISDLNISFKNFAQPIRCLILGEKNGPSISDIIYIVGKRNFIDMIENL